MIKPINCLALSGIACAMPPLPKGEAMAANGQLLLTGMLHRLPLWGAGRKAA